MSLFVLFAPIFLDWPIEIVREIKRQSSDTSIIGMATGQKRIHRTVLKELKGCIDDCDHLADLERSWMSKDVIERTRERVSTHFTEGNLNAIVMSDRHLGSGYVSGAFPMDTKLAKESKEHSAIERYVFNLCDYVIETFETRRIEKCFLYTIAGAPAFAIAIYCESKGIPFYRIAPSRVGSRHLLDTSIRMTLDCLDGKIEHYKSLVARKDFSDENIIKAWDYIEQFRQVQSAPLDHQKVARSFLLRHSLTEIFRSTRRDASRILKSYLRPRREENPRAKNIKSKLVRDLRHSLRARQLGKTWPYGSILDVSTSEYAFFPLHVNPEATTMVFSPMFTDQVMIIEALSKSIPLTMKLVVKEHLVMLGRRPEEFYRRIAAIPKVVLVSPFADVFKIIKSASLITAITGTSGLEGAILGKPVLVFSDVSYSKMGQGLVKCTDLEALPDKVAEAMNGEVADTESIIPYIAAIFDQGFDFDYQNSVSETEHSGVLIEKMARIIIDQ